MKILYSACWGGLAHPFGEMADEVVTVRNPMEEMTSKDAALVIWGGADISPTLYGHPASTTTYSNPTRDAIEWACIKQAIKLGISIIGVCRGAQMLCAAAGGFLFQDVEGHADSNHPATTYDGKEFMINSIHHQMMAGLEKVDHELLAWSTTNRSPTYIYKDDKPYVVSAEFKEPEMVYFPKIKGLAIQWHPEAMHRESAATQFIFKEYHGRFSKSETI